MIRNTSYLLKHPAGEAYLLPIGQALADMRRGVKLNSTGELIWNLLENDLSDELLAEKCAEYFEIGQDTPEYAEIKNDILAFTGSMFTQGLLNSGKKTAANPDRHSKKPYRPSADSFKASPDLTLNIAGMTIGLYGDSSFFSDKFKSFTVSGNAGSPDIRIRISTKAPMNLHSIPHLPVTGRCLCIDCREKLSKNTLRQSFSGISELIEGTLPLINHPDLTVYEEYAPAPTDKASDTPTGYSLYFHEFPGILKVETNIDCSGVCFYCTPDADEDISDSLFYSIRMIFLFYALTKGHLMLHSASVLYRGKAWLFSGSSGTGKSTHAGLWKDIFGTPLINGDLNLINTSSDGCVTISGTPWCGTSGIFDALEHELGGIVFLKQAPFNRCEELTKDRKHIFTLNRLISPMWTEPMLDKALEGINRLEEKIPICRLCCTPEPEAARVIKAWIDENCKA